MLPGHATGSAFVRYREDGERDFVFNIRHSASAETRLTDAAHVLLAGCGHLHVMGSSLFSPQLVEQAEAAVERVQGGGGTVSFDPNVRKEMLVLPGMREALLRMLRRCDLFLPSGAELTLLTEARSEAEAIDELLALGVPAGVGKPGAAGASYHARGESVRVPAFRVREVDPTGAGDCFGATFVTCRRLGHDVRASLRYACASGARAVLVRGPMQGVSGFAELEALIASSEPSR